MHLRAGPDLPGRRRVARRHLVRPRPGAGEPDRLQDRAADRARSGRHCARCGRAGVRCHRALSALGDHRSGRVASFPRRNVARNLRHPMPRVLVTGGAGTIGSAVVRRLLRDPSFEVRIADHREPPQWMRESCEIVTGDLRDAARGKSGCRGLLTRHPPRRDRRRDRELPQAPLHADRDEQRSDRRAGRGLRSRRRSTDSCTSPARWCSNAQASSRPPRNTSDACPHPKVRIRLLKALRRGVHACGPRGHGLSTRSAAHSTPTAPASCPNPTSPASRTPSLT